MNPFTALLSGIKGLAIDALIPLVTLEDAAIGKEFSDAVTVFSDSKLTFAEAQQLALDAIDIVAEKLPKFANGCALLKKNITDDIPVIIEKLAHLEATYKAFQV